MKVLYPEHRVPTFVLIIPVTRVEGVFFQLVPPHVNTEGKKWRAFADSDNPSKLQKTQSPYLLLWYWDNAPMPVPNLQFFLNAFVWPHLKCMGVCLGARALSKVQSGLHSIHGPIVELEPDNRSVLYQMLGTRVFCNLNKRALLKLQLSKNRKKSI